MASELATSTFEFGKSFLATTDPKSNALFSPLSIVSALVLAAAGSGGTTRSEMLTTLAISDFDVLCSNIADVVNEYTDVSAKSVKLDFFNSAFVDTSATLHPAYRTLITEVLHCGIERLDFQHDPEGARRHINSNVSKCTHGLIPEAIPPRALGKLMRLVLANAVYFKGDWRSKFKKAITIDDEFFGVNRVSEVPMMSQTLPKMLYREDSNKFRVAELPFKGEEIVMNIFLPEFRTGYAEMREYLLSIPMLSWVGELEPVRAELTLPRFEYTTPPMALASVLQSLGIRTAFSKAADFTGISDVPDLYIGQVFHGAKILVNESGAEAAAATVVGMKARSRKVVKSHVDFRVDHPFMFLLRDRVRNVVLFVGQMLQL